jgi:single-strand DNA-binding protein
MASVNKVILLGNCGKDPEVRYLPSGAAVTNISLATSSVRKDKNSGEKTEETQWHRVVFFERLAEIAGEYLKKGHPVYIEGHLKYGKYTDKDGIERYTTDIVASSMQLLGRREDGAEPRHESPRQSAPRQNAPQSRPARHPSGGSSGFDDMDDDIPFQDPMKRRAFALSI